MTTKDKAWTVMHGGTTGQCIANNCNRPKKCRHLCTLHYERSISNYNFYAPIGRWAHFQESNICNVSWCQEIKKPKRSICSKHANIEIVWGEVEPTIVCVCGNTYAIKPAIKGRNRIRLCDDCYINIYPLSPINVSRYGITRTDWVRMYIDQKGKCAINNEYCQGRLVVDHDHKTGLARELLCQNCNMMVGRLESDRLYLYAKYINKHAA